LNHAPGNTINPLGPVAADADMAGAAADLVQVENDPDRTFSDLAD
jgi:hypothetical protein